MLESLKILEALSAEEKANLSLFCQEKDLAVGEILFNEWDDANALYILQSGELEVSKQIDGVQTILGKVHAEEIIGEMALFKDDSIRMATAIATMPSKLVTILWFSIKEITQKHPELLERIKDIIAIRNMINKNIG